MRNPPHILMSKWLPFHSEFALHCFKNKIVKQNNSIQINAVCYLEYLTAFLLLIAIKSFTNIHWYTCYCININTCVCVCDAHRTSFGANVFLSRQKKIWSTEWRGRCKKAMASNTNQEISSVLMGHYKWIERKKCDIKMSDLQLKCVYAFLRWFRQCCSRFFLRVDHIE